MNDDKRRASTDWRLEMSARAIVAMGIWSLLMVLVATMTIGGGPAFLAVMAVSFATLIVIILTLHHRRHGHGP